MIYCWTLIIIDQFLNAYRWYIIERRDYSWSIVELWMIIVEPWWSREVGQLSDREVGQLSGREVGQQAACCSIPREQRILHVHMHPCHTKYMFQFTDDNVACFVVLPLITPPHPSPPLPLPQVLSLKFYTFAWLYVVFWQFHCIS